MIFSRKCLWFSPVEGPEAYGGSTLEIHRNRLQDSSEGSPPWTLGPDVYAVYICGNIAEYGHIGSPTSGVYICGNVAEYGHIGFPISGGRDISGVWANQERSGGF